MKTSVSDKSATVTLAVSKPRKYPSANKRSATQQTSRKQVIKASKPKVSLKASKVPTTRPEKQRLVRDSFTIPKLEYQILVDTKKSLIKSGVEVRKTELIRVGLLLIGKTSAAVLKKHLASLQKLKSGRPKKSK
jgi:hypothetical protein